MKTELEKLFDQLKQHVEVGYSIKFQFQKRKYTDQINEISFYLENYEDRIQS